jgi:hypothetical protein
MGSSDNRIRQSIGMVPHPANQPVYFMSQSISQGGYCIVNFIVNPIGQQLSLWDFFFSVTVDQPISVEGYWPVSPLDQTVNDFYGPLYLFPDGPNVRGTGRANAVIQQWGEWAISNDATNRRVWRVLAFNNDTASHVYYITARAYTFSPVGSVS